LKKQSRKGSKKQILTALRLEANCNLPPNRLCSSAYIKKILNGTKSVMKTEDIVFLKSKNSF